MNDEVSEYKKHNRFNHFIKVNDEMIKEATHLATCGLKNYEIAGAFGISVSAFYSKCKEYPELRLAVDKGRSYSVKQVTEKLFELASQGNVKAIEVYLGNIRRNMPVHYSEETGKILKDGKSTPQQKIEALLQDHINGYISMDIVTDMIKALDTLFIAKKLAEVEKKIEEMRR